MTKQNAKGLSFEEWVAAWRAASAAWHRHAPKTVVSVGGIHYLLPKVPATEADWADAGWNVTIHGDHLQIAEALPQQKADTPLARASTALVNACRKMPAGRIRDAVLVGAVERLVTILKQSKDPALLAQKEAARAVEHLLERDAQAAAGAAAAAEQRRKHEAQEAAKVNHLAERTAELLAKAQQDKVVDRAREVAKDLAARNVLSHFARNRNTATDTQQLLKVSGVSKRKTQTLLRVMHSDCSRCESTPCSDHVGLLARVGGKSRGWHIASDLGIEVARAWRGGGTS